MPKIVVVFPQRKRACPLRENSTADGIYDCRRRSPRRFVAKRIGLPELPKFVFPFLRQNMPFHLIVWREQMAFLRLSTEVIKTIFCLEDWFTGLAKTRFFYSQTKHAFPLHETAEQMVFLRLSTEAPKTIFCLEDRLTRLPKNCSFASS